MISLGVNIDHVATLREARQGVEPEPVWAASLCELAGCHCITLHLREDRRHIQDRDLKILKKTVSVKLNLEMAITQEIVSIAKQVKPDQATLVPEKRVEITTEGGLEVVKNFKKVKEAVSRLKKSKIETSLFIEPDEAQIKAAEATGAGFIELHTGSFANAGNERAQHKELKRLIKGAEIARKLGLRVNAGHGINYQNIRQIVKIPYLEELNIGHSIISRAVFVGLERAVKEMLDCIRDCSLLVER